jgi:hypothetical protein
MKNLMFSCSFTAALLAHIRGGGNVFSLLVGMMLISNGLLAQNYSQSQSSYWIEVGANVSLVGANTFKIETSLDAPDYDYAYPDGLCVLNAYFEFSFFSATSFPNTPLQISNLMIPFNASYDSDLEWHNTTFFDINTIAACSSVPIQYVRIRTYLNFENGVICENAGGNAYSLTVSYDNSISSIGTITYINGIGNNTIYPCGVPSVLTSSTGSQINNAIDTTPSCDQTISIQLNTPIAMSSPLSIGIENAVICQYGNILRPIIYGGCSPYTVAWATNTGQQISPLTVTTNFWDEYVPNDYNIENAIAIQNNNTYIVTVTDANGNSATTTYVAPLFINTVNPAQVSYFNNCIETGIQSLSLYLTQGSTVEIGHYNGSLFDPYPNLFSTYTAPTTGNVTLPSIHLPSGNYVLRVRSFSIGVCSDYNDFPFTIDAATITPAQTNGCITQLTANAGGTSYAWSNGATTQSITTTGNNTATYTVTVTNATVCSTASYSITQANVVACCQSPTIYQINVPIYTATSATWSPSNNPFNMATINVNGAIVVPNGVTLTINNMAMNFSTIGKIVVQKGGRLNLNATILDGLCNSMWLGIQAEGNGGTFIPSPLPLGYQYPGGVFTNNTIIRNAVIGITNTLLGDLSISSIQQSLLEYEQSSPVPYDSNNISSWILANYLWTTNAITKAGGVVNVQNTTFTNCFQGINLSWRGHKLNKIETSRFDVLGSSLPYPFTNPPLSAMTNKAEAGVVLMGTTIDELGTAWALASIKTCTFSGYRFGIRSNFINTLTIENCQFNSNPVGTSIAHFLENPNSLIRVRQNTYSNCRIAIQASGVDNLSIRDNHIDQGLVYNSSNQSSKVGIYTRGCNALIKNNTIEGNEYPVVFTDDEADGTIFGGNVMNNCYASIIAEGDNTGVQMRCNHILNRQAAAISVRQWATNGEFGALADQGNCFQNQPAAFTITPIQGSSVVIMEPNTLPFTIEDIGANTWVVGGGGFANCLRVNCDQLTGSFLEQYCNNLDYTSIGDIEGLIGSGGIQDKAIAEVFLNYLEADNYTAALELLYAYQDRLITQRRLVPTKIIGDQTTDATALLQTMPNETEEAARYKQFYGLLATLKATHRNLIDLTPAEESLLMDIANSRTKTAFKAQTCLYVARGKEFPVLLPTDSGSDYTVFKQTEEQQLNDAKVSPFVPNPSTSTTNLAYQLSNDETGILTIYDYMGRTIANHTFSGSGKYAFNTNNYPIGIYAYTVRINDSIVLQDKLIIAK